MIGRVRGTLAALSAEGALVDVGGVGYEVLMSGRDLAVLPALGEEVVVHTHFHVREDHQALYGFVDQAGRDLFRVLLGASGIGPKIALAMLATLGPDDLRRAVMADDVALLTTVPGIGTRTAQKLILDLRARLELPDGDIPGDQTTIAEVRDALENLGYASSEITEAMSGLDGDGSLQDLLRAALQRLGGS